MGAKKPVNLENLEGLGARRLAEILLELGEEDAERGLDGRFPGGARGAAGPRCPEPGAS